MWTTLNTGCDFTDHRSEIHVLIEYSCINTGLVHRQFVKNEVLEQTHLSHLNLLNILRLLDLVICTHAPNVEYFFD